MGALLTVAGVSKGFSRGGAWTGVLDGVSFEVEAGEVAAVVGPRLAGKTTLLQIAAGVLAPDGGSVTLRDAELTALPERRRTRLLGHEIVWIDRAGPGLDVEVSRFVGWPLVLHGRGRREAERMAAAALARVGASECAGRTWRDLSDSRRLSVGLARAFAGSPSLVVVDDLLDGLSGRAAEDASDLLRSLVEESSPRCAVLMSASEIDSAVFADRLFSLARTGTLRPLAGVPDGDAEVIPFRARASGRGNVA
jgi:predicted ABC-type transport system involved in lysophospholipase L1 biosynthesis ATPase subunit